MVRAAPLVIAPDGQPGGDVLSGIGGLDEKRRIDRVMADLALAFAHEIDIAHSPEDATAAKWPIAWTLAFAIATSGALWVLVAGFIYFIYLTS